MYKHDNNEDISRQTAIKEKNGHLFWETLVPIPWYPGLVPTPKDTEHISPAWLQGSAPADPISNPERGQNHEKTSFRCVTTDDLVPHSFCSSVTHSLLRITASSGLTELPFIFPKTANY